MLFRRKFANQTVLTPPWNKGKLVGQKPPLHPKHVWAIRTQLQMANKSRDLALFNLAIDSKLRGCDLVALKVEDIAPNGYAMDRATVRRTGREDIARSSLCNRTKMAPGGMRDKGLVGSMPRGPQL